MFYLYKGVGLFYVKIYFLFFIFVKNRIYSRVFYYEIFVLYFGSKVFGGSWFFNKFDIVYGFCVILNVFI